MTGLGSPGPLQAWPAFSSREAQPPGAPPTLLIVDSDPVGRQLFRGVLKVAHYRILEAADALGALAILRDTSVDLLITDLVLRDLSGLDLCRKLKADKQTRLIPILVVTSVHAIESEIAGLESGADEFLVKPVSPMALRTRIRAMLRTKHVIDSLEEAESILFALARIVDSRDSDTGDHCQRLADRSVLVGATLGLPAEDLSALRQGGFLHDIGKIAISDTILRKSGPLDSAEWALMRQHTIVGESICRPMRSLLPVLPIIRHHHERWDGSGYPDGLAGEEISLLARIVQLGDIYDAITSRRSYKAPFSSEYALAQLQEEVDRGWRDPALFSVFRSVVLSSGGTDTAIDPEAA
ncbi:MAG: HD domain-containing phosphohydrolase [Bryobacteraceae bacterium]